MGVTFKLVIATIIAGGGSGFQHGYNIGVINAPEEVVRKWIKEVYESRQNTTVGDQFITTYWSFVVSVYCIGGILGSLMTSLYATYLGRRNGLIVNNIFAIIAGILMGAAKYAASPELLLAGRFVTGYNCGLNCGLCAMYLVEIATVAMRGAVGTVYQLVITMSILISQIVGLKFLLGTEELWPIAFGLIAVVGLLQMVLLIICPESPKYLFTKKGEEKCLSSLTWLRGSATDAAADLALIKAEAAKEEATGRATCKAMITESILRRPMIISNVVMLAQQLSGINAVMYYSTNTFLSSGFSIEGAQYATLCMGAMNVLMTVVSLFLVDIAGRKTLLLVGFAGMFLVTAGLAVSLTFIDKSEYMSYLSVFLVVMFVVFFATGPGSIPWFLVAELFSADARPLAASLACGTNWIANFIVGILFLPLQLQMGALVFILFCIFQLLTVVYIALQVPETKSKTYEEIVEKFK